MHTSFSENYLLAESMYCRITKNLRDRIADNNAPVLQRGETK